VTVRTGDVTAWPAWGTNGDKFFGIAPALVTTAELDLFRDEAATYAQKLDAAPSQTRYQPGHP
jgi:acetyl esterase/lipase